MGADGFIKADRFDDFYRERTSLGLVHEQPSQRHLARGGGGRVHVQVFGRRNKLPLFFSLASPRRTLRETQPKRTMRLISFMFSLCANSLGSVSAVGTTQAVLTFACHHCLVSSEETLLPTRPLFLLAGSVLLLLPSR